MVRFSSHNDSLLQDRIPQRVTLPCRPHGLFQAFRTQTLSLKVCESDMKREAVATPYVHGYAESDVGVFGREGVKVHANTVEKGVLGRVSVMV